MGKGYWDGGLFHLLPPVHGGQHCKSAPRWPGAYRQLFTGRVRPVRRPLCGRGWWGGAIYLSVLWPRGRCVSQKHGGIKRPATPSYTPCLYSIGKGIFYAFISRLESRCLFFPVLSTPEGLKRPYTAIWRVSIIPLLPGAFLVLTSLFPQKEFNSLIQ